jgi:hypothetical protein
VCVTAAEAQQKEEERKKMEEDEKKRTAVSLRMAAARDNEASTQDRVQEDDRLQLRG